MTLVDEARTAIAENPDFSLAELSRLLGVNSGKLSPILKKNGLTPGRRGERIVRHPDYTEPRLPDGAVRETRDTISADSRRLTRAGLANALSIGAYGEMIVCADLLSRGFDVFRSVSPSAKCDIVAIGRFTGKTFRIESRMGRVQPKGKLQFNSRGWQGYDLLAVVVDMTKVIYKPDTAYRELIAEMPIAR